MKKVTLVLTVVSTFALFSCGGSSSSNSSKKETEVAESVAKTEPVKEVKKEENTYVKDKFLQNMDLKATKDKYSQQEWEQISKTCKAYSGFKKTTENKIPTKEEFTAFFKDQGYSDYQAGKDDIMRFKDLYKISMGIPTKFGSLNGTRKLYGDEKYKEACKSLGEEYNELGLSANDLKNIEKHSDVISEAYLIAMSLD